MLHISIKPDVIMKLSGFPVTNTYITSVILVLIFFILALYFHKNNQKRSNVIFFTRFIIDKLFLLFEPILEDKTYRIFPLTASIFLFVLFSNWIGLLPGVGSIIIDASHGHESHIYPLLKGSTADLNTTLALATFTVLVIQFYSISYLGLTKYIQKFISIVDPVSFYVGILELISEISKIISFAFRLFGNIFAGEVLILVIAFLIPFFASFPFLMLEIFVGFIQALVFSMLAAVFIQSATSHH